MRPKPSRFPRWSGASALSTRRSEPKSAWHTVPESWPTYGPSEARRPGAWLIAQYDIGYKAASTDGGGGVWRDGVSLRAGMGLDATWWMRVEAGGGVDLVRMHAADI